MLKRKLTWWGGIGLVAVLALMPLLVACAAAPEESAAPPTFAIKFDADEPGCGGACHEQLAPWIQPNPEGKYTLAYEANQAYAEHGFDPQGKLLTLNDCLACHAVGTGDRAGKGNVSSKSLRDIVHRVHPTSEHFTVELEGEEEERQGDCFTCHVISGPSTTGLYE